MGLRDEILEQPAVAERFLEHGLPEIRRIADSLADREIDLILIAARGTSDHAAIYAQYLFGALYHLPVDLATPSTVIARAATSEESASGAPGLRAALPWADPIGSAAVAGFPLHVALHDRLEPLEPPLDGILIDLARISVSARCMTENRRMNVDLQFF